MNPKLLCLFLACSLLWGNVSSGQSSRPKATIPEDSKRHTAFTRQLEQLVQPYAATVGVAMIHIEKGSVFTLHQEYHYPMQSVYKFPLALAVLHQVDLGKLSLEQKVHIRKEDLRPTWSPLRKKYPEGNIDLTIKELLDYTVSQSDNNTCDILFGLVGGPVGVAHYLQQCGIKEIQVRTTEAEMATAWNVQYQNSSTPLAMATLLNTFYKGKMLSAASTGILLQLMTASGNSANRIKGLLPAGTVVAHKTGTSDTNDKGVTAATNDAGIITLPDGNHIALAVFVSDSKEHNATNEQIIAKIAKVVFELYGDNGK